MLEFILWGLMSFFATFGIIQLIRLIIQDSKNLDELSHIIINLKDSQNIEKELRNIINTFSFKIIILDHKQFSNENRYIINSFVNHNQNLFFLDIESYTNFITNGE